MTDPTIHARLDDACTRRISSSSGARVQGAHFAPCVLDLLGHARPRAHVAMEQLI
jgi:hypothetical protein